jgi:hypothetical protein
VRPVFLLLFKCGCVDHHCGVTTFLLLAKIISTKFRCSEVLNRLWRILLGVCTIVGISCLTSVKMNANLYPFRQLKSVYLFRAVDSRRNLLDI